MRQREAPEVARFTCGHAALATGIRDGNSTWWEQEEVVAAVVGERQEFHSQ
jgi:hypothetical protein